MGHNTKAAPPPPSRVAIGLLTILILVYFATFAWLTVRRHESLHSSAFDLGNYVQPLWNTFHGQPLRLTTLPDVESSLGLHVEPILLPIALLYFLWSDPRLLLILQTLAVALAAMPLFALARLELKDDWAGVVLAALYLLYTPLEAANFFDFHPVTLAPAFLLSALYFLRRQRYGWMIVFLLAAMSTKEEVSLIAAMFGLYIILVQRRPCVGAALVLFSVLWFYVAVYVIIAHFNAAGRSPFLAYFARWGDNPVSIAWAMLNRPSESLALFWSDERLAYLATLLGPFAFLSLLGPEVLLLGLPSLAINLVSDNPIMRRPGHFAHYSAAIVPFVVAAALIGIGRCTRWIDPPAGSKPAGGFRQLYLLLALTALTSLVYHRQQGFTPLASAYRPFAVTSRQQTFADLTRKIPPTAALSATEEVAAHLSHRARLYIYPTIADAEYALLAVPPADSGGLFRGSVSDLERGGFGIIAAGDGLVLLQRGAPARAQTEQVYTAPRLVEPAIQYPLRITFGDALELLGYNVVEERSGLLYFSLQLFWRATRPVSSDYRFFTFLADGQENAIPGTETELSLPFWYPTSRWRPGEVLRADTFRWTADKPGEYRIVLGVFEGPDRWDAAHRLPARLVTSDLVVPLRSNETLVQIASWRADGWNAEVTTPRRVFTPPRLAHPLRADLGGRVRFLGYDLACQARRAVECHPGGELLLTLYWQALTRMDTSFTVFVHLLDAEGRTRAQRDGLPVNGDWPTTRWLEGEIVADNIRVPLSTDIPPGVYTLAIGLYDLASGGRLTLDTTGEDRVILGKVRVEKP